ncbi:hypothetical protein IJH46_01365 [Candidatus Saccharibacteria bacterium]|nr:hypothetical protein [Candidatus Saccharibacteria bacterium]
MKSVRPFAQVLKALGVQQLSLSDLSEFSGLEPESKAEPWRPPFTHHLRQTNRIRDDPIV